MTATPSPAANAWPSATRPTTSCSARPTPTSSSPIAPRVDIPLEEAETFDCQHPRPPSPRNERRRLRRHPGRLRKLLLDAQGPLNRPTERQEPPGPRQAPGFRSRPGVDHHRHSRQRPPRPATADRASPPRQATFADPKSRRFDQPACGDRTRRSSTRGKSHPQSQHPASQTAPRRAAGGTADDHDRRICSCPRTPPSQPPNPTVHPESPAGYLPGMSRSEDRTRSLPAPWDRIFSLGTRLFVWGLIFLILYILRPFFLTIFLTFVFAYIQAHGVEGLSHRFKSRANSGRAGVRCVLGSDARDRLLPRTAGEGNRPSSSTTSTRST